MRLIEVDPLEQGPREDVIEVHAKAHEAGRGPFAELGLGHLVELREGVSEAGMREHVLVHGRTGERVEVARDEESVAPSFGLDEADEVLRLLYLVRAVPHARFLGPEVARERGRQAEVRVEDVDGVTAAILEPQVRADAGLLQLSHGMHVAVGDVGRHVRVVVVHLEVAVGEDREPGRVDVGLRSELVARGPGK